MPGKIGNKNAAGHDGSKAGRKSLRDEQAHLKTLESVAYDEVCLFDLKEEVDKSMKTKGYKIDPVKILRYRYLTETSTMNKVWDKLIPLKGLTVGEGAGVVTINFDSAYVKRSKT